MKRKPHPARRFEVVITESPKHLRRRIDEETGLALIRIDSNRVV